MSHPSDRELTLLGQISLGFVAASLVFYQMLVWSEAWRVHPSVLGWRLWWASVVTAVGLGWLQVLWRAGALWKVKSGGTTLVCTGVLGGLMIFIAVRPNPADSLPAWWSWLAGLLALEAAIGSLVIIGRWVRNRPKSTRPLPPWMKPALYTLGTVALCAGSFYIGRVTMPPPSPFDLMPSALAAMPTDQIEKQVAEDLRTLKVLAEGMDDLRAKAKTLHGGISRKMQEEERKVFTPTESRAIRRLFIEYLSHRESLIRMAALYSGYPVVKEMQLRHRAYLLGYCAAAVALDAGLEFVERYRDNEPARDKLNEAEPGWLKKGMFDKVYHSVTSETHLDMFEAHGRLFATHDRRWRSGELFAAAEVDWMIKRIRRGQHAVDSVHLNPLRAWFSRLFRRMQEDINQPVYDAQKLVATFVGDTRIVRRAPFIPAELVRKTLKENQLQPGDIILERRNWYLSNAFLPGFWPHCALYVGTPKQLAELDLDADSLGKAWAAYVTLDHGQQRVIMEAVSEGLVFATAEHSLTADYVAVLRPRLSKTQKAEAIRRAFGHHGKSYDFNFDFGTADKLVCSELLYHAYEGLLDFQMETVLGKKVITPLGIMNKFANERGTPNAQLDFVLFLDTPPGEKHASLADAETCCESVTRAKAFNE